MLQISLKSYTNIVYHLQKNGRDFEKLQRALNPNELAATLNNLTVDQRMEYLDKTFTETVSEYRHILDRVDMADD